MKFTPEYELYSRDVKATLTAELTTPDGQATGAELACGDDVTFSFEVHNPKLWWPNGMTAAKEQPLYTCRMALVVDGKEVSSAQKKIGLRKIELDRGKDHFGTNFRFRVNGVDIFCKGANWIPEDSFTTRTDDKNSNISYARALSATSICCVSGAAVITVKTGCTTFATNTAYSCGRISRLRV